MVELLSEKEWDRRRFEEELLYRVEQRSAADLSFSQPVDLRPTDAVVEEAIASALSRGGYLPYEQLLHLDFDLWSREVSHSLTTPLAHIEVTARNMLMAETPDEVASGLHEMLTSVDMCKAFLAAFRDIARVSREATSWQPGSLADSIRSAFDIYQDRSHRPDVSLDLRAPASIGGYTNTFLLVVVMPLIENAIEASPPSSQVNLSVWRDKDVDAVALEVANLSSTKPDPESMLDTGYSTKGSEHHGLGLRVVQDFVRSRDGELTVRVDEESAGTRVTVSARLPISRESGRTEQHEPV